MVMHTTSCANSAPQYDIDIEKLSIPQIQASEFDQAQHFPLHFSRSIEQ